VPARFQGFAQCWPIRVGGLRSLAAVVGIAREIL
jgi:hypothetical protein